MNYLEILILAMLVDAVIGEPRLIWSRIPHPAVLMGRAVAFADARLNHGGMRVAKGGLAALALAALAFGIGAILALLPGSDVWEALIAITLIAHRSLIDHVRAVAGALELDLDLARSKVGMIVGRDTGALDESGVARAAIESGAENFSDGVVAPAFWFLLFGAPGILTYKMINTADSMIGHKNHEYSEFGRATARLDDLMNWIPARITAGLLCIVGRKPGAWAGTKEDAVLHRSPNAGWPEAAMAYTLGIALAGPRKYEGITVSDPYMNGGGRRDLGATDIRAAIRRLWLAWGLLLIVFALLALLFSIA